MSRLQVGVVRHASVGSAIARAIGSDPEPECRLGQWRITLTFRGLGASRWPEDEQVEYAIRAANVARAILTQDVRRSVRRRATRAIEIVYEDASGARGCAIVARWECVVTAAANEAPEDDADVVAPPTRRARR